MSGVAVTVTEETPGGTSTVQALTPALQVGAVQTGTVNPGVSDGWSAPLGGWLITSFRLPPPTAGRACGVPTTVLTELRTVPRTARIWTV